MAKNRGFSIIELMMIVAILGVLAAIAGPAYVGYMEKSRDTEAKTLLAALHTGEKVYFLDRAGYTNNFYAINVAYARNPMFDCGFSNGAPVYGPNEDATYPSFAEDTPAYCALAGCSLDSKYGAGGVHPKGLVNNAASPPTYIAKCHRHNKAGAPHVIAIDQDKVLYLEQNAF